MATKTTDTAPELPATGENGAVNTNTSTGQGKNATGALGENGSKAASDVQETYTVAEFAQAAEKLFPDKKTRPSKYLITAAFRCSKLERATREQGIRVIEEFMKQEVK